VLAPASDNESIDETDVHEPSIQQEKDEISSVVDDKINVGSEDNKIQFQNKTIPHDLPSQANPVVEAGRQETIARQSPSVTTSGKHTEHTPLEMKKKFGSMIAGLAKSSKSKERPKDKPKKEKKEKNKTKQTYTTTDTSAKESVHPNTQNFPSRPVTISRSFSSVIPSQMSSSEKVIQSQPFTMNRPTQITENTTTSLSRSAQGIRRPPPPIPAKRPQVAVNSRGRGSFARDPTETTKLN
jgi:uncharacterized membrane protein YfhO